MTKGHILINRIYKIYIFPALIFFCQCHAVSVYACVTFELIPPHGLLSDLIVVENKFIAVSFSNWVYESTDGKNWNAHRISRSIGYREFILEASGEYITGGVGSELVFSNDLRHWETKDVYGVKKFKDIIWTGDLYLSNTHAIIAPWWDNEQWTSTKTFHPIKEHSDAAGSYPLNISGDGINWESTSELPQVSDIIWSDPYFYALTMIEGVYRSEDGKAWQPFGKLSLEKGFPRAIRELGSLFVVVGDNGSIFTSKDGINWEQQPSESVARLYGIASNGNIIVVVGACGEILTSAEGKKWLKVDLPYTAWFTNVAWNGKGFLAVGYFERQGEPGYGEAAFFSENGNDWIDVSEKLIEARKSKE